jgi:hypothetical protein
LRSVSRFGEGQDRMIDRLQTSLDAAAKGLLDSLPPGRTASSPERADARVPVRNPAVKGPLSPSEDWVMEKAGRESAAIAITRVPRTDDVTYEIVNFIDGTRTVAEIKDAVSAEFEPIEPAAVSEYLDVLAKAGAITFRP